MEISVHEAKTHLSRLLNQVATGEEVVICSHGGAVAKRIPYGPKPKRREGGSDRGLFSVPDDFDDEDPDIIAPFEG